ncbi:hypothetical protein Tco_0923575 [Tanacetum coccineum]|uniref:Uncharacterized protein n=1 Tax=Tanacetum coccineum TaxID=301880 RepID=A0ABQ5D1B9_9ASTR
MLERTCMDSWKFEEEITLQNREHRRMILESVENGSLIWRTVEENGVIKTKKYVELSATEKIQVDFDMKATNIILQGLLADICSLVNHHRVAKDLWERVQLPMQGYESFDLSQQGNDFLTVVASFKVPSPIINLNVIKLESRHYSRWQGHSATSEGHMVGNASAKDQGMQMVKEKAMLAKAQEVGQILDEEQLAFLADLGVPDGQAVQTIIPNNVAFQTEDLDTYDSDCDDILNAKAVLLAKISNYGSDVISEAPHCETYLNDMENQSVHAMQDFEQTPVG